MFRQVFPGDAESFADPGPEALVETTVADLQRRMRDGQIRSAEIVDQYLARIETLDRRGPGLRAVLEVNPQARAIAAALDRERDARGPRGALHGIPILLKDNIDTADGMLTTAGSLALCGSRPAHDATAAAKLREAGAVILGKANLSEWANFRSRRSTSGWSARGGLTVSPYVLDRTACGSSSGSAAAVSANLAAASVGTETDGSIVCPAAACGVVGIKPTLGLTSRAGVIPIAHSQDTVGPFGRTVADAAAVLGALAGVDPRDPATEPAATGAQPDYTRFLDPDGLRGVRIGIPRKVYFGYQDTVDQLVEAAIEAMRTAGATIVDPADIPTAEQMAHSNDELTVLQYELKEDLNRYLAQRGDPEVHTLQDLIDFNRRHMSEEMPYFGQDRFLASSALDLERDRPAYLAALANNRRLSRQEGIDAVMDRLELDALCAPSRSLPWKIDLLAGDHSQGGCSRPAALAGYPAVSLPAGFAFGLPVGITFMGRAFSEGGLIKLASGFEHVVQARRAPGFLRPRALV